MQSVRPDIHSQAEKRRIPGWLVPAAGYAVALASFVWVFHGVDFPELWERTTSIHWWYVAVAMVLDLLVYVCHAWRWDMLLQPVAKTSFWRTVQSIYIGLYANEILPLRTGEVLRIYLMAHWNRIPIAISAASAAVERVVDGLMIVGFFAITTSFVDLPNYLEEGARIFGCVLLVLSVLLGWLIFHKHHAHAVASRSRFAAVLAEIIDGLHEMGNFRTFAGSVAISLLYVLLQILPIWILMRGFQIEASFWTASALLAILRLGTVIPNAPGNAGLYQFFCVLGLGLFGVDKTTAAGFSSLLWSVLTLPLLIGGFIAVAFSGLKLDELRKHAQASARKPLPG